MAGPFDFTGQNIENTYQRVLQTPDGINMYDGTGSLFHLGVFNNTSTGSYGSFYDTGSYLATSTTAIYSMSLSSTDISNGVYIDPTDKTKIYFINSGVYNLQFSAQFTNADNTGVDTTIWLRKNDVGSANDIPDSAGITTIPPFKAGQNGQTISGWNYYITVAANDYIQLLWAVDVANKITLETLPAGVNPTHPRVPSLILTAQRVDTFFSNTGSFSGSFNGIATTASYVTPLNQNVIITGNLTTAVEGIGGGIDTSVGQLLWDNGGGLQAKVDWANGGLTNASGVGTLDWEGNALTDNAATPSIDWGARTMLDSAGIRSYNYDSRKLVYLDGTTVAIDYGIKDQVSITGSVYITDSLSIKNILQLARRTTTPSPAVEGMIIASGSAGSSKPYYYDGSSWKAFY